MGLLSEVEAATKRPTRNKFEWVLTELGSEADEFLVALHDPIVPALVLERVLKARGVDVSDSTLLAWRRAGRGLQR